MNAQQINLVSGSVVDAAVLVHQELGPGLLESVYEIILAKELRDRGLHVERQLAVPIEFRGIRFEEGYKIDLLVEETIILELKSVESLSGVHKKQLLTYLRLLRKPLGLLLNFNTELMKDGIVRIANNLPED